ncbi:hypothetical protein KL86PLE_40737 [uncultured Pleomorphomonas sp.]|uniref:Uncharacterized protein n=1 Tax=uncultured Pleomorphomonas sp. TaxID=442121 RepID=A0A212LHA0_9HYPH|nr:hypothetical protein KL86PLE_40737 [uncultured Pleomorphomonas sp.]
MPRLTLHANSGPAPARQPRTLAMPSHIIVFDVFFRFLSDISIQDQAKHPGEQRLSDRLAPGAHQCYQMIIDRDAMG